MDGQKPLILALDTSTACCTLALTSGTITQGGVLASLCLNGGMTHSRRLLTAIDWLFSETEVDWSMIDGLAVGLGPGSFTGLRIGLATAKGLAVTAGKLMGMIGESVLIVGDGVLAYGEQWQTEGGDRVELAPVHLHYPSAAVIGLLGGLHLQNNRTLDPATAVPFYVRASDAELSLQARHNQARGGGE